MDMQEAIRHFNTSTLKENHLVFIYDQIYEAS